MQGAGPSEQSPKEAVLSAQNVEGEVVELSEPRVLREWNKRNVCEREEPNEHHPSAEGSVLSKKSTEGWSWVHENAWEQVCGMGGCLVKWAPSGQGLFNSNYPVMLMKISAHLKGESFACLDWRVTLARSRHLLGYHLIVTWVADHCHAGVVLSRGTEKSNTTCTGSGSIISYDWHIFCIRKESFIQKK